MTKYDKHQLYHPECTDCKEEEKCPECNGTGRGQFHHNRNADCDDCNGTGKLTKTLKHLIEGAQNGNTSSR